MPVYVCARVYVYVLMCVMCVVCVCVCVCVCAAVQETLQRHNFPAMQVPGSPSLTPAPCRSEVRGEATFTPILFWYDGTHVARRSAYLELVGSPG